MFIFFGIVLSAAVCFSMFRQQAQHSGEAIREVMVSDATM
jgi:hypothetical protein